MDARAASQGILLSHPAGTGELESANSRNSSGAEVDGSSLGDHSLENPLEFDQSGA